MRAPAPAPPQRPGAAVAFAVSALVGVAAAAFAHVFVLAGEGVLRAATGFGRPAEAALGTPRPVVFVVVVAAVAASAGLATLSRRAGSGRTGLRHVAVALDGDPADLATVRPSLRATFVRAAGTFASSVGFTSIGRETAMIETGGALGATLGQRFRVGPSVAVAGVAAAFTGAYTAPLAALAYCDDHLGLHRNRRDLLHALVGVAAGYGAAHLLWDHHTVLPHPSGDWAAWPLLGAVVVVPAAVAGRMLFAVRRRVEQATIRFGSPVWLLCLVAAALAVVCARAAAGNGMNALALAAAEPVLWAAAGLALFRVAGMIAALAAGVPGGVILPTMSICAGWGLLAMIAVERIGVDLPGTRWDGMILAAAAGVATGLRAPLLAVVMVPEMVGDYRLVPFTAAVVGVAVVVDRLTGRMLDRTADARRSPEHPAIARPAGGGITAIAALRRQSPR